MRVAEFFTPEDHEIRQREMIRLGSERLVETIWREHPERCPPPPTVVPMIPIRLRPRIVRVEVTWPTIGKQIVNAVAEAYGIEPGDIVGERRWARFIEARALVAHTLRSREWSYPQIARILKRDHSSIINLCGKLPIYRKRSEDCEAMYHALAPFRKRGG